MALGLGYWQMMRLDHLPQALKIIIPDIVNTFIGLFKDTTLVFIVGIFDFLQHHRGRARRSELGDAGDHRPPAMPSPRMFYLVFCFAMSRYARAHRSAGCAAGAETVRR